MQCSTHWAPPRSHNLHTGSVAKPLPRFVWTKKRNPHTFSSKYTIIYSIRNKLFFHCAVVSSHINETCALAGPWRWSGNVVVPSSGILSSWYAVGSLLSGYRCSPPHFLYPAAGMNRRNRGYFWSFLESCPSNV